MDQLWKIALQVREIRLLGKSGDVEESYALASKASREHPDSSELRELATRFWQLSELSPLELDEIETSLNVIAESRGFQEIWSITDALGFKYNVLDKCGAETDELFETGYSVLTYDAKEFLTMYFDFLSSNGRKVEIAGLRSELKNLVDSIPDAY